MKSHFKIYGILFATISYVERITLLKNKDDPRSEFLIVPRDIHPDRPVSIRLFILQLPSGCTRIRQ